MGKFYNTLRWFKHGLSLNSKWTDALFGTAVTYFKMSKYKDALKYIQTAIECYDKAMVPRE